MGNPPTGYEHCGYCTQIAILVRNDNFKQGVGVLQNKFELYIKEKKNLYLKNREIQFNCNNPDLKLTQEPYFNEDLFEKCYVLESDSCGFKLVFAISYPFENFDFETEVERQSALLREINSIVKFLTVSYKGFGSYDEKLMNEEEREKLENNIPLDDDSIRLASLSKLLEFPILKKFKYSNEKIIEIMKENNYRFTFDNNYVVFKIEENPNDSDSGGSSEFIESQYNDEIYQRDDFEQDKDPFAEEDWQ